MVYTKIIHQIWYDLGKGKDVPEKYKEYQKTWIVKHPEWKYILWTEEIGDEFMKTYYNQYYDAYKNVKYPIMKIDILRYCILEQYGGMYVDIDYKCLTGLDDYLSQNANYDIHINETPNELYKLLFGKNVSNSLIISKPNHPFWKLVISECFNRIKTYSLSYHIFYVVKTTGPGLINDMLNQMKNDNNPIYKQINILPFDQFNYCNECNKCRPSKTNQLYAVHDYVSLWNSNLWLQVRKLLTCLTVTEMFIILIFVIVLIGYIIKRQVN